MKIEDIKITQQSVNQFFNEINTEALVDSLKKTFNDEDKKQK